MRHWTIIIFFAFQSVVSLAQYTNNWVSPNQTYYKISVATTGLYRLTYNQLQQAGVPVNSIDPRLIQLYHRGVEQAILFKHDQSPADANFDSGEYLEFFGQRNDGTLDAKLYQPASVQPHKYYNLFSDTSAYFLTVNPQPIQGKRMDVFDQVNSTSIPKETSHTDERLFLYTSEYSGGDVIESYIQQSFFDEGEGWTGNTICTLNSDCAGNEQRDFPVDQLTNTITSLPPPTLEIQLTGRDDLSHKAEIYVGPTTGSLRLLTTSTFQNFQTPVVTSNLNWSDFGADGKMAVRVKALGVNGLRERLSVSYIKVKFAQGFNNSSVTTKTWNLNANAGGKSYIEIDNAPAGTRIFDITDPSSIIQIGTRTSGSLLTAMVANTSQGRKLYSTSTFLTPATSQVMPVSFRAIRTGANFIIVTHRSLMQPGLSYSNPVEAYAAYRASGEGGSYDTLTITIDQLYNQFNYGETSPLAITEFMRYMIGKGQPAHLFLIGKGRDVAAGIHRRTPSTNEYKDLVPTAGNPGSDMAFTAGMKGEPFVPAVSTGRLTATNPSQVAAYLNKVKEAEAAPFNELWRKKILHLSGGIQANELVLFKGYMQGFAEIAKGDFLGGDVVTLGKHGVSNIEFINISKEINAGLDLVTFFGHSASNATDIDIGYVSEPILGYNNPGKYPAFLVNGCNAGEFFNNGINFGEDWMLAANKGARNFIANSSFGFDDRLNLYSTYFYKVGFGDSLFLGKGIGEVQQEAARRYLRDFGDSKSTYTAMVQQMVLLGDPSLRLFAPAKPDYETSDAATNVVAFDDKPLHALTDSIEVQIVTRNLGRSTKRPLSVRIIHTIDDVATTYEATFNPVRLMDTLKFPIRRGTGNFFGENKIEVFIDPNNKIDELNESNNNSVWTRFIQFNGTQNLQPANFGIVSSTSLTGLFQDTDLLSEQKTYALQLDTTKSFNSPFAQSKTVTGKILMKVQFTLSDKDSTVYYWRSKPSDKPDDQWETTSFTYIKNGPAGWTQMAFDQLTDNSFNDIVVDETKKEFQFETNSVSIFIKTFGSLNSTPGISASFQVNNAEYYYSPQGFNCRNNTINLVAFDRSSVVPYLAVPFTFQNAAGRACGREPQLINSFTAAESNTGNGDDMIQAITNLKPGDSVVLFTMGDAGFASWTTDLKTKAGEIGIRDSDIDTFLSGEPIIILGRKGAAPGTAKIIRSEQGQPAEQELQLSDALTGYVSSGSMTSVLIGPALKWNSFSPGYTLPNTSDEVGIDIHVIGRDGKETLFLYDQKDFITLDGIDASLYPYLRLVQRTSDEEDLTPTIVDNWLVAYDPAPDGILLLENSPAQVNVQEGVTHTAKFGFVNISAVSFADSLETSFSVFNHQKRSKEVERFNIKGPAVGDTTHFSVATNTTGRVGLNDVSAFVNNGTVVEQYYQNNSIELSSWLNVLKDKINPVLEVTVDGRFLNNGDFVSSNPLIVVSLRDDNVLLTLKDTTSLNLLMTFPCATGNCQAKRINFSGNDVKWSVTPGGVLTVEYRPKDLAKGDYVLFAEGKDASGNPAGPAPYEIEFVVEDEPGVIFYSPYPNPSNAGFFFDFAIAGNSAPESFVLQIINRDGQDVAKFTEEDAPHLRVGLNQLRWNGLDSQGYRLSDGLYFYQITVQSEGGKFKNSGRLLILK